MDDVATAGEMEAAAAVAALVGRGGPSAVAELSGSPSSTGVDAVPCAGAEPGERTLSGSEVTLEGVGEVVLEVQGADRAFPTVTSVGTA